jgi:hypothetical protein
MLNDLRAALLYYLEKACQRPVEDKDDSDAD